MGFYVAAGVYSIERDLSQIVPNLLTSSAGIVGYSVKGDVDEIKLMTNSQQFIQEYGEPVTGYYFHYSALAYLEKGNVLYCKRVVNGAKYGGVKIRPSTEVSNAAFSVGTSAKTYFSVSGEEILFEVFGKDPGVWNADVGVRIENIDDTEYSFDLVVYCKDDDAVYQKMETWTVSRKHKNDGYGNQMYLEEKINGFSSYIAVANNIGKADTVLPKAQVTTLAFTYGSDGSAVSSSHVNTGWNLFANPDDIDVRILINGGYTDVAVQTKMKTIVEDRKDCIAVLDIPSSSLATPADMITWRNATQNFNSSYTALYGGWLKINDDYNGGIIVQVPTSGYMAAQMAYNDYIGEPWTAPAGTTRGMLNVIGVTNKLEQGDLETMYVAGINPIRFVRGRGIMIWGQKTQQTKASALDRLNVRRSLIVMEKAISIALYDFVFENNSVTTRFRISAMVEDYFDALSARGAFQTTGDDKGYRIVCDETNNTPAIIARNELHVDVFVKPIRTAEFIQLQTIVTATSISFDELIAKGSLI